ncbi:undecaprenyldiphospho-muramoylpentapeptide beta-N-acetylglucosaminyltransferase [Hydrogenobacter thermophilus]|uniref:undecaprenyldiphospho-muramoylpentapeptide beta-N-acetylglucosaminyltransferase n=1 Tax=Hydrogenobacter thermophilus TaxID=940 RepID=UPI0030F83EDC
MRSATKGKSGNENKEDASEDSMKFLVSGGGTGGHFFPAIALIECMLKKGLEVEFIGSERGIEYRFRNSIPCDAKFLKSKPFVGQGFIEKVKALYYALFESARINAKEIHAGVVFGGYASLPLGFALTAKRKPLYLHEQNSVPSLTNTLLSKFSKKVFITFEYSRKYFKGEKVIKTGLPVRRELLKGVPDKEYLKESFGFYKDLPVLLVIGGSQGATFLNDLALSIFSDLGIQGIHITGEKDKERTESYYKEKKLPVKVFAFSDRMDLIYGSCDIALSRAGASTITELSIFGIPALFIPYPFSARNHQFYNAKEIEQIGGGILITQKEASSQKVVKALERLLSERESFSKGIKRFANPNACEEILKHILS